MSAEEFAKQRDWVFDKDRHMTEFEERIDNQISDIQQQIHQMDINCYLNNQNECNHRIDQSQLRFSRMQTLLQVDYHNCTLPCYDNIPEYMMKKSAKPDSWDELSILNKFLQCKKPCFDQKMVEAKNIQTAMEGFKQEIKNLYFGPDGLKLV